MKTQFVFPGVEIFAAFLVWCVVGDLFGNLWWALVVAVAAYPVMARAVEREDRADPLRH